METILDEELPRSRLTVLLKHFSQIEDGRQSWRREIVRVPTGMEHLEHALADAEIEGAQAAAFSEWP
jgi:hypothetical protein